MKESLEAAALPRSHFQKNDNYKNGESISLDFVSPFYEFREEENRVIFAVVVDDVRRMMVIEKKMKKGRNLDSIASISSER